MHGGLGARARIEWGGVGWVCGVPIDGEMREKIERKKEKREKKEEKRVGSIYHVDVTSVLNNYFNNV